MITTHLHTLYHSLSLLASLISVPPLPPGQEIKLDTPKLALRNFKFRTASVLPVFYDNGEWYVLLTREGFGGDKGMWDDFGGAREPSERHPELTAAHEFFQEAIAKETMGIKDENAARNFIDVDTGNTITVIAQDSTRSVTYITRFSPSKIDNFVKTFYQAREEYERKKSKFAYVEKDLFAFVKWYDLKQAIENATLQRRGNLIVPTSEISVNARVKPKGEDFVDIPIQLRPILVAKLSRFFKGKQFRQGKHPAIRFYTFRD